MLRTKLGEEWEEQKAKGRVWFESIFKAWAHTCRWDSFCRAWVFVFHLVSAVGCEQRRHRE